MNILIAEDDETLGHFLGIALPRVITGSKPVVIADALEMATTMQTIASGDKAGWPAVVISDYHLIAGTGEGVLHLAAKLFPDAKLILMSGGADEQNVEAARKKVPRPFTFLPKPFDTGKLVQTILEPPAPTAP